MKKSMVFLISALTFMIGLAGGIVAGIFLSPVKNGMDTKIYFSECWNVYKPGNKNKKTEGGEPHSKIISISEKGNKKGLGKWIGRK